MRRVFSDVDAFAADQGGDPRRDIALVSQLNQQITRFRGDQVF
jgi:hypothetical protein